MTKLSSSDWVPGRGDLPKTVLHDSSGASAEIYAHGAHLTKWQSAKGKNWIFTSELANFDGKAAIRGGVPIIFPQFNAFGDGPRHGFARNLPWHCDAISENQISMSLHASDATAVWPHQFSAQFSCAISDKSLAMTLSVKNESHSPFEFTCALHTYFQISSLDSTKLEGLRDLNFWDNDGSPFNQRHQFADQYLNFDDAIDRVFFDYQNPLTLHDGDDKLAITHTGFCEIVVWNPGEEAAKTMSDFADREFNSMLCIEAAQIDKPIKLAPGETWRGQQICIESE